METRAARDAIRIAHNARYGLAAMSERPDLGGLAELAARVCGVSRSMILYFGEDEVDALATYGFDDVPVQFPFPSSASICNDVLYEDRPFVSPDLLEDDRFRDSLAATAGIARFYATFQLRVPGGDPIGSLCVFDPEPRVLDDGQLRAMTDLADRVVDVLELDLRNRELRQLVGELARSNEHLAAFAGQVSHDLRNPLGAVSGTLEILADLAADAEPDLATMRVLIDRAHSSTRRMAHLVGDVLDFAVVGGRLEVADVDVAALVRDVLVDLSEQLAASDVQVGPLAAVRGDHSQLRILVQNLLSNAIKFAAGTSVAVAATRGPEGWTLRVVDHGPGIPADERARVLEPFVRLGHDIDGTGMGLATCVRIATAHGGTLELLETPGGGTTVAVRLPV